MLVAFAAVAVAIGTLLPLPLSGGRNMPAEIASDSREILLMTNPIHTDIAIPLDAETLAAFAFASDAGVPVSHPEARWLVIGWGGRAFYLETPTWADLKPGPLFKGLTLDRSVLHLDVVGAVPDNGPIPGLERISLDKAGYDRLIAYVRASFTRDAAGRPIAIEGRSYGFTDRFFEAEGWFNAIVGCNVWASKGLRVAGVRTGAWTPMPQLLSLSLRLHN